MSYESLHCYSPALKVFQTWGFLEVAVKQFYVLSLVTQSHLGLWSGTDGDPRRRGAVSRKRYTTTIIFSTVHLSYHTERGRPRLYNESTLQNHVYHSNYRRQFYVVKTVL